MAEIMEKAHEAGAISVGYTYVRLNGAVGAIFENWIKTNLPDRAEKVLHQIKESHGGKLNDSQFGRRMRGEGPIADGVSKLFKILKAKYFSDKSFPPYNCDDFQVPPEGQLRLF